MSDIDVHLINELSNTRMQMNLCRSYRAYWQPDSSLVKALQGHLHRHLRSVYMTGFSSLVGVAELVLYILGNATALERMVVDSVVRNGYESSDTEQIYSISKASEFVPRNPDKWKMFDMDINRKFAKEHLERE